MKSIDEMNLIEIFLIIFTKKYELRYSSFDNIDLKDLFKKVYEFYCIDNKQIPYNEDFLYNWLKEKYSYKLLTQLLDLLLDEILEKDKFMFYNLPWTINIMYDFLNNCSTKIDNTITYQYISKKETDTLVSEILKIIDPSLEWLKIYEECKKNNIIIYINEYDDEQLKKFSNNIGFDKFPRENKFINLGPGKNYIILDYKNNLDDTISTIHEFIHYIIQIKSIKIPILLNEFFPIFYEMHALYFLKQQGYALNELISLFQNERIDDLCIIEFDLIPLFKYLKIFVENKFVTFEDDFNYYIDLLEKIKLQDSREFKKYKNLKPEDLVYKKCEKYIISLLNNDFFESYPYVMGAYLSFEAMSNFDKKTLVKIKKFLDSNNIDPYDIFKFIGCDVEKLKIKRVGEEEKILQKEKRH